VKANVFKVLLNTEAALALTHCLQHLPKSLWRYFTWMNWLDCLCCYSVCVLEKNVLS